MVCLKMQRWHSPEHIVQETSVKITSSASEILSAYLSNSYPACYLYTDLPGVYRPIYEQNSVFRISLKTLRKEVRDGLKKCKVWSFLTSYFHQK